MTKSKLADNNSVGFLKGRGPDQKGNRLSLLQPGEVNKSYIESIKLSRYDEEKEEGPNRSLNISNGGILTLTL